MVLERHRGLGMAMREEVKRERGLMVRRWSSCMKCWKGV
jgi:hypothetical protein